MRRNVRGIVDSISNLLVLFLLYMVVIFLWAFIGINLIGDIDEFIPIDKKTMDYGDFMNLSYMLYVLSTMDNFPDM